MDSNEKETLEIEIIDLKKKVDELEDKISEMSDLAYDIYKMN